VQHRETKTGGTVHHRYAFESLHALGEYINAMPRTWDCRDSETATPETAWDLKAGYAGAVDMARFGWIEGAQKTQAALKRLRPYTPKPRLRNDVYGFRPNVPRYCAGAPDCMVRNAPNGREGSGRALTLAIPVNALASVSAVHMANFGTAVARYINQLEAENVRVEVIGMIVSNVRGQRVAHSWTLKRASQPLDLAVLSFSIGHPAMFRRLGFALRERSHAPCDPGYGSTVPATAGDLINAPAGVVVLNGMAQASTVAKTPEDALAYISKAIDAALAAPQGAA